MISVVVPVYNGEKYIEACLGALLDQTVPSSDYEIVVVDDGSTDRTAELVSKFPVRYIHQENQGPAKARNVGMEKASGDIVLFTDSDCTAERDWIERMTHPLADGKIGAVKGAYRTRQKGLTAHFAQVEFEERYKLLKRHEYIDFVDTYSAAFRKAAFIEAGGFDSAFPNADHEDTDLSYRLAGMGCKMVFAPEAIVYHEHPDSIWKYFKLKLGRGYWRMVVYRRHPEKMVKDTYTPQSLKLQILAAFFVCCCIPLFLLSAKTAAIALAVAVAFFLLCCVSFWKLALSKNALTGLVAPIFLFIRAFAIGSGVGWALLTRRSL